MLVSSLLVTAISISQSFAPAFSKTDGMLGIPFIVLTSKFSDTLFNLFSSSSITVTSKFSRDSLSAMLYPTSPAPQIIVFID